MEILLLFFSILLRLCVASGPEKGIHYFFYIWYGTPDEDGDWRHWNHEVLPHWEKSVNKDFPSVGTKHYPPGNIHSPYYPLLHPYSSSSREILMHQFRDMVEAGGTVAVVSWWGQATKSYATDTQGVNTDRLMSKILHTADAFGKIKIAFHLEPYHGRSVESVREDLEYISTKYGHHPSLYRAPDGRPLYYVYDSYHLFPSQWRRMLQPDGDITVRGTALDAWFVGLWLDRHHGRDADESGFDGIYTYFASESFSFGSTTRNWPNMCQYCRKQNMMCILSVGPGYNDTSIRPWNAHNARDRRNGKYYEEMWMKAIEAEPSHISITSFNEWGEGTQIEPARAVDESDGFSKSYLDYGANGPYHYLHLSARFAEKFHKQRSASYTLKEALGYEWASLNMKSVDAAVVEENIKITEGVEVDKKVTESESESEDENEHEASDSESEHVSESETESEVEDEDEHRNKSDSESKSEVKEEEEEEEEGEDRKTAVNAESESELEDEDKEEDGDRMTAVKAEAESESESGEEEI